MLLVVDEESIRQAEITNTDAEINLIDATTKYEDIESIVMQIEIDGTVQTVLHNVIRDETSTSELVVITNLEGIVYNVFEFNDGVMAGEINLNSYTHNDTDTDPCWGITCGIDLDTVFLNNSMSALNYLYTNNIYSTTMMSYQFVRSLNNYSTMGTAYANYYIGLAITAFNNDINDNNLDTCLKNILNNLKNIPNSPGNMVAQFTGNFPGYNWNVQSGSLSGQTASTDPPAYYNPSTGITTTFDSQAWLGATNLSWARTILHESIHAYLASYYAISRPGWIATYPEMVQDWGALQNWNDVHHEEIARSLVTMVAAALQDYGELMGYNLSTQFYEDMSWAGLQNTSTFNALSASEQKRILDVIAVELTGKDTDGNIKPQQGTDAGC